MPVLPLRIHHDGLLSVVAPLGAAAAVGTALVVDLDPSAPPLPGRRTLADLAADGPSAAELRPSRPGVAVLPSGGVAADTARPVVDALVAHWPMVVLRVRDGGAIDVAPVFGPGMPAAVLQPTGLVPVPAHRSAIVLPHLPARVARALVQGRTVGGRWVRAWQRVWTLVEGRSTP